MTEYNLKRDSKLYIVYSGQRHSIDIYPDLSFSQTFSETSVPVKTLHKQADLFEDAAITKANPANFNFTIPILRESDLDIVLTLLTTLNSSASLNTADIYVENNSKTFKLETSVFESGVFRIDSKSVLILTASGTARKLSEFSGNIPGSSVTRSNTNTFVGVFALSAMLGSEELTHLTSLSVEIVNTVSWLEHGTLHKSLDILDASGTSFPEAFVVESRRLSGTLQRYITKDVGVIDKPVTTWSTNTPMTIRIGDVGLWALRFNLPSIVYTSRIELSDFYIQSYDFRLNTNNNISDIIVKENIRGS